MGTSFHTNNMTSMGETYSIEIYKRKENSAYEWKDTPEFVFKGKPASTMDKKKYRLLQGVNSSNDSMYVYSTNLPENVSIGDKVKFLGKEWQVESIGYYFDSNRLVNAGIMSDEYIISRCPKGITLN